MSSLLWLATLTGLLVPILILLYLYRIQSRKDKEYRFEKIQPPETKTLKEQSDYRRFGEKIENEDSESRKIVSKVGVILTEFKKEEIIDEVDRQLIKAIVDSKKDTEPEKVALDYLSQKNIVFSYSHEPVLHPWQDYSCYFQRLITLCRDDFEQISFNPEEGLIIDGKVFYDFNTFLAFPCIRLWTL